MKDGETLFDLAWEHGPLEFSRSRLARVDDLFEQRNALFYTPSQNLPSQWIGTGTLSITLPIVTPTYYEYLELRHQQYPRMWVDLLQRATGKLRWQPMNPARVHFRRHDTRRVRDIAMTGMKALLDALKVRTSGRRDGRYLHYFGAIIDDANAYIGRVEVDQALVSHPREARVDVFVELARSAGA